VLHDTVAQSLGGARSLRAAGDADPRRHRLVHELVAEAEEQVRAVMARTRPPAFRDGDLGRAVAGLRDDLGNRYGVVVAVEWPADPQPLPLATAVTVYRFFQEALLNVVKHADVDTAHATLRIDGDWLEACVQDDGAGFDPDDVRSEGGRHVGLGLLQQRARLMGGSVSVGSWPDPGTTVTLRLPCTATGASGRLPVPRLTAVG
jgi:signal transduction histidine kinase